MRALVGQPRGIHSPKPSLRDDSGVRATAARTAGAECHVVTHCEMGEEKRLLREQCDAPGVGRKPGVPRVGTGRHQGRTCQAYVPGVGSHQAREHIEQRRLSRSVRSEDGERLAFLDHESHVEAAGFDHGMDVEAHLLSRRP
jgi:hypothetical protein